jgi:hypothetical protein
MDLKRLLALALDPSLILAAQGMTPDPWQREMLLCPARHVLLNCSRGAGKTRVTSALALHTALFEPGALVLLVSRAQRQAGELLRYCKQGNRAIGRPVPVLKENEHLLELAHGSRIVSLPGKEETIRSFQGVRLLVLDEAARVPDDLYGSVSPMTGTSQGRTVCLSTPFGQRGFFWREWFAEGAPWVRFRVPWQRCPRLTTEFIAEERRKFGDGWVAQEYETDFRSVEGLVYPDFEKCLVDCPLTPPTPLSHGGERGENPVLLPSPLGGGGAGGGGNGRLVGGIDFGFRNPFAALWGVLDHDGILHITAERYLRETPLHEHARALPAGVMWYADPAGRTEIEELRAAGHKVRRGPNDIRPGIAAVTARIRTGRLKVHTAACPNLLAEARLYRYPSEAERTRSGENPVDENNHALAALRYLICGIDARSLARPRPGEEGEAGERGTPHAEPARPRIRLDDPDIWET